MFNIKIINLDRRPDRYKWCTDVLEHQGYPAEIIERITARDAQQFPTHRSVLYAMKEDGFPAFESCEGIQWEEDHSHGLISPANRGHVAAKWSYMRTLRQIVDENVSALILEDDYAPRFPYEEVQDTFGYLLSYNQFLMAQMTWWIGFGVPHPHPDVDNVETDIPGYYQEVIGCGQWVNFYTPEGAARVLEYGSEYAWEAYDIMFPRRLPKNAGFYTRIPNDFSIHMENSGTDASFEDRDDVVYL